MAWTSLCDLDELAEGHGKYVEISGFELAVFLSAGKAFAIDNTCPHAGGNLSAGEVEDNCAVCPWHRWSFHLDTGALRGSVNVTISRYPTRLLPHEGKQIVQADLPIY